MRPPPLPPSQTWRPLVEWALAEDVGAGDVTSHALLDGQTRGSAHVEARESLVLAGLPVAAEVFARCDVAFTPLRADGDAVSAGDVLARVEGSAISLLTAERTALNFLQRLSGVATHTARFVDAVRGTNARIVDTRKTTPGWRTLEKYAVRCGGGTNHRAGLFDGVLIKDNHIAAVGSICDAVKRAQENAPSGLVVQVEVESVEDARAAIGAGARALLVDNQPDAVLREVVALAGGRVSIEATGGVTLASVRACAETGVDRISIGALTHSAPAVDIALEWDTI